MYEHFYGLRERPFDLVPNPRFLFLSNGHRAALTHLKYGLTGRPGLTVLIGDAGTGKTTLVMAALRSLESPDAKVVHLSNPTLSRAEFYEYLAPGFGFSPAAGASKAAFLRELEGAVANAARREQLMALIVDEAQSLPYELLEEIRLLTNVEDRGRSLTVILVGQPELADRLNDASLRQLKQRIALRNELSPLSLQETAAYIAARIRVAGGAAETIFTREAVQSVHAHAAGIPRTISAICDNALVNGFATSVRPIGPSVVLEACRDLHIDTPRVHATPAPKPGTVAKVALTPPAHNSDAAAPEPDATPARAAREPLFGAFGRRRRFSFFSS